MDHFSLHPSFEPEAKPLSHIGKMKAWWTRYERHATTLAFIAGFIFDNLTLRRVDLWLENLVFLSYLLIAEFSIIIFNAYDGGRLQGRLGHKILTILPLVIQFVFGNLFSGFFVFYSRSASLVTSWPFLLFLFFLFIGNEIFKKRYLRLTFQTSIFFIAAFSYAVLIVPVLLKSIGVHVFILSGVLGLVVVWNMLFMLRLIAPERYARSRSGLRISIIGIYLLFNVFYFTNIIPPVPLALKSIGLYHSVVKNTSGGYDVTYESVPWYDFRQWFLKTYHHVAGERTYVFAAVFAPTRLSLPIVHRWSYFDSERNAWKQVSESEFTITGGRDGGYRGYSFRDNVRSGKWRVEVLTKRGQLIGRTTFEVVSVTEPLFLERGVR